MSVTSDDRGHVIEYRNGKWIDPKSGNEIKKKRCRHCGELPTEDGYDACIAGVIEAINQIPGVRTVESCCGHGTRPTWIWCDCCDQPALSQLSMCYEDMGFDSLVSEYNNFHKKWIHVLIKKPNPGHEARRK